MPVNKEVNLIEPEWKGYRKEIFEQCHKFNISSCRNLQNLLQGKGIVLLAENAGLHKELCEALLRLCGEKASNISRPGFMGKNKKVSCLWQAASIDICGPLSISGRGFVYLLAVSDYFPKFVLLHPLRKANTKI